VITLCAFECTGIGTGTSSDIGIVEGCNFSTKDERTHSLKLKYEIKNL
jgi:hypothetical protein